MNIGILSRITLCIFTVAILLYSYINQQNAITQLRLKIPSLSKELQVIKQENTRFQYEIDRFENPLHLMELARRPEYSHLKHPMLNEIITIQIPKK